MNRGAGSQEVSGGFVPTPRPDIASVEVDGEGVLYDPESHGLHVLNATAMVVWELLDGHASIDDLVAGLAIASETEPRVVHEGIVDLILDLVGRGLLVPASDGEGSG